MLGSALIIGPIAFKILKLIKKLQTDLDENHFKRAKFKLIAITSVYIVFLFLRTTTNVILRIVIGQKQFHELVLFSSLKFELDLITEIILITLIMGIDYYNLRITNQLIK